MRRASLPLLFATCVAAGCVAVAAQGPGSGPLWAPLNDGNATVATGAELLAALAASKGDIAVQADIYLQQADWQAFRSLPIRISAFNRTVLIHGVGQKRVVSWGYAVGLLSVDSGTTLALENVSSQQPGNRTKGVEQLEIEVKGSALWPTVTGEDGHKAVIANSDVQLDIGNCNPDFVQVEVARIQTQLEKFAGPAGRDLVHYEEGVTISYVFVPFPATLFSTITKQQVGTAQYTLSNMTSTCFDSSAPPYNEGDSGGTPSWVWAVVGSVLGCAALALVAAAFLWRRKRHLQRQLAAADEERLSKSGSALELASQTSGKLLSYDKRLSAQPSGEMQSTFLRTRFGPIDGVQLGELLGRGAFGRVYRGRWKGAIVAVKVIEHRVGPGKTHDLSREPLLSMSVSHPNTVTTHKMCVVKVLTASGGMGEEGEAAQPQQQQSQAQHADGHTGVSSPGTSGGGGGATAAASRSSSSGGNRGAAGSGAAAAAVSRSGSGQLVPNLEGSGLVELVSPHEVLQPGMYETWLITELCDRGSLAELIHCGRLAGLDRSQRDIWVLLCMLDVALGLDYLHSNTIIHGDLKPANVLLKAARNDRRSFVCKLGDFGLSRMLGVDESHVETQSYGTASYAAPELLAQGKLTKAADIYSLGIIMWEMLTAEELYPGLTAMQVILQVSQHAVRPTVPDDCLPGLADLMQRCWAHDPAERPQAAEVVEDLRGQLAALRPAPVAPPPGSTPPRPPLPPAAAAAGGSGGAVV